jgi:hypothetical protein
VTGKPLQLDLTRAIRKVKLIAAISVPLLTTLLLVMQRGFTWWQGVCFAYCVCLSVVTTGMWGTLGRALDLVAESVLTELQLVRNPRHCNPAGPLHTLTVPTSMRGKNTPVPFYILWRFALNVCDRRSGKA